MRELINKVLSFGSISNNCYNMLVIQIDDTDLNINKAYEIVEDIRKYLVLPNVVVIMAARIDELTKAVEQQYRKDLQ